MPIVTHSKGGVKLPAAVNGEQLKNLFKSHDQNGDGLLDKNELKEAFKRLGALLPGWRASHGLKKADADGDGLISEEELTELVKYAIQYGYTVK